MATTRSGASSSRLLSLPALLVVAVFVAAGCGAASTVAPDLAPAPRDGSGSTAGDQAFGQAPPDGKEIAPGTSGPLVGDGSQIIRTGSLQLQVDDVNAAVDAAKTAVARVGGFVASSKASGGDQPVAVISYRVPSDRWDEALAALKKLAVEVVGEQTDSTDVSAQLVDIDARLKNLRAAETALQEIAAKATRVTDVLEVQNQLTQVRGQIESLAAQQKALQNRVDYATLTVTFGLQVAAVTQASREWDPAREVDNASARLIQLLQGAANATIWFAIVWLPALLMLAIILLILRFVARRLGIGLPPFGGRSGDRPSSGGGSGAAERSMPEPGEA